MWFDEQLVFGHAADVGPLVSFEFRANEGMRGIGGLGV